MKIKKMLKENNLSELVIFERQVVGKSIIKPEHYLAVQIFAEETKKKRFDIFCQKTKLSKGENFKSEYTKMLKSRIKKRMAENVQR